MKKLLLVLSSLLIIIGLCSCGEGGLFAKPTPTPVPEIDPAALITLEDVVINAGYTPVVEASETKREGNSATIMYRSEPIGWQDPVIVKVTQFTNDIGYQTIFEQYEANKAKRTDAEIVGGIGQEAYIAFPTIHMYNRGVLVEITAGSGADDTQKNMLKNLAIAAATKLEAIIPEYKAQ